MLNIQRGIFDLVGFFVSSLVAPLSIFIRVTRNPAKGSFRAIKSFHLGTERQAVPIISVFIGLLAASIRFQDFDLYSIHPVTKFSRRWSDYFWFVLSGDIFQSEAVTYHLLAAGFSALCVYVLCQLLAIASRWKRPRSRQRIASALLAATSAGILWGVIVSIVFPALFWWTPLHQWIPPNSPGVIREQVLTPLNIWFMVQSLGITIVILFFPAAVLECVFRETRLSVRRIRQSGGDERLAKWFASAIPISIVISAILIVQWPPRLAAWFVTRPPVKVIKIDCKVTELEWTKEGPRVLVWAIESRTEVKNESRSDVILPRKQMDALGVCWSGQLSEVVDVEIFTPVVSKETEDLALKKGESALIYLRTQSQFGFQTQRTRPPICEWRVQTGHEVKPNYESDLWARRWERRCTELSSQTR